MPAQTMPLVPVTQADPLPAVIPIPGATRPETILDSVQAAALTLSPSDLEVLGGLTDEEGAR